MQQITRAIYLVDAGETITVEIEATKVGNFASFVLDGNMLSPTSTNPLSYQFVVSVPAGGTHHGMLTFFFPDSAPDDAEYQVFVTGSAGGGRFTGSDVVKTDPGWVRGIEFRRS
jgi:hypothetical protein